MLTLRYVIAAQDSQNSVEYRVGTRGFWMLFRTAEDTTFTFLAPRFDVLDEFTSLCDKIAERRPIAQSKIMLVNALADEPAKLTIHIQSQRKSSTKVELIVADSIGLWEWRAVINKQELFNLSASIDNFFLGGY